MRVALFFISVGFLSNCSLVTVPVKTAGSVVKTTVSTAGKVVEAPFKAANGGYRNDRDHEDRRDDSDEHDED